MSPEYLVNLTVSDIFDSGICGIIPTFWSLLFSCRMNKTSKPLSLMLRSERMLMYSLNKQQQLHNKTSAILRSCTILQRLRDAVMKLITSRVRSRISRSNVIGLATPFFTTHVSS